MTKTLAELEQKIKAHILEEFLPGENPDELTTSTPLLSSGVLDSIAAIKLVDYIELTYGVELEAHEISADYLDTVSQVAQLVHDKTQTGQ